MNIRSIAAFCVASVTFLTGCNGVGAKDSLVARFNDESVYEEDLFLVQRNISGTPQKLEDVVFENIYAKAAAVAMATSEFPGIEKDWEEYYKQIEPRILMMAFQRYYVIERMMYSDSELRRFYDTHKSLFPAGEFNGYIENRQDVASEYYVSKNREKYLAYVEENKKRYDTEVDTTALKKIFADDRRRELRDSVMGNIVANSGLTIHALPAVDFRAFYETHKDKYKTVPGYVVYHIQMNDSAALASKVKDNFTLEQFKQAAAKISTNKVTAENGGYVGHVKKDFALPYGIGLIGTLSGALEGKSSGFITPVLRADGSAIYHRFYLAERVDSQYKTYERVAKQVETDAADDSVPEVEDSYALITAGDGKVLFTEGDLKKFFNEFYEKGTSFNMNAHNRIVNMFENTLAYAVAAEAVKLGSSWEVRALSRSTRWNYLFDRYVDRKLIYNEVSKDSLKKLYEKIGSPLRPGLSFEQAESDLKAVVGLPKNIVDYEYYYGYGVTCAEKSYEQCLVRIYSLRFRDTKKFLTERLLTDSYGKVSSHFYKDYSFERDMKPMSTELLATIDSLKNAQGKINLEYRKLMLAYPENDSLFRHASFEMAQLHNDNEEYDDAEKEYYAYYRMWPESDNAEKAMFSRGFILNENLKKDSLALEVFREFIAKYPNSELKESAEWLAKNIESNGKLSEDLLKKIESEQ